MKAIIVVLALLLATPASAQVPCQTRLDPVAAEGIRNFYGELSIIGFLSLVPPPPHPGGTQDRTVAEFDISNLPTSTKTVTLVLDLFDLTPESDSGQIVLHTYEGDGVVVEMEYFTGSYHSATLVNNCWYCPTLVYIDVTDAIIVSTGLYIGFRLSSITDRYRIFNMYLCVDDGTPIEAVSWGKVKRIYQ